MTSKSSFLALSKFQIKRKLWVFVLCFVGWFFILPFITMLVADSEIQSYLMDHAASALTYAQKQNVASLIIYTNISGDGVYGFLVGAMAVFVAIHAFLWNNDQKQVDFYRSVPVKESTRFIVTYLNGILIYLVTFGINLILVNITAAVLGVWIPKMIIATLWALFINLAVFLAAYSIALIAQLLTGNVIVAFLGTCVLVVIEPAIYIIRVLYSECFFETYSTSQTGFEFGGFFSPLTAYIRAMLPMFDSGYGYGFANAQYLKEALPWIAVLLIQAAVFTAIAYYIYKKRPPMTAGKTMLFAKTKPVIKSVIMIITSLLFGYLLAGLGLSRPKAYGLAGIVLASVILQLVIELIYEKDIKKVLSGKISFAVSLAAALAIFCIFAFDLTGYDRYIPKKESVEYVSVDISGFSNGTGYIKEDYSTDYYGTYMDRMKLTDDASKAAVISTVTERIRLGDSEKVYESGRVSDLEVVYKLKNGSTKSRYYTIPLDMAMDLYTELYKDQDYKMCLHPIFSEGAVMLYQEHILPEGLATDVYEYGPYEDSTISIESNGGTTPADPKFMASYDTHTISGQGVSHKTNDIHEETELYIALCEDILNRDVKNVKNEIPVGFVMFYVSGEKNKTMYPVTEEVFASDKKTMALIKEHGWLDEDIMTGLDTDNIHSLNIHVQENADKQYTYGDLFGAEVCEEADVDPEMIAFEKGDYMGSYDFTVDSDEDLYDELFAEAIPGRSFGLFDYTVDYQTDTDISIEIVPDDYNFCIRKGDLADKVREAAKEKAGLKYQDSILMNMGMYDGENFEIYSDDEYIDTAW